MKYLLAGSRALLLLLNTVGLMVRLWTLTLVFGKDPKRGFRFRRKFALTGMKICGITLDEVDVYEPNQTVLYVCNHRTLSDIFVPVAYMDGYIIAKAEISSMPIVSQGAEMTGIIFVNRGSKSSRQSTMLKTKELLANGQSVVVFAEGTTTIERTTRQFKKGTFRIAAELGVPIVPIAIEFRDEKDFWKDRSTGAQFVRQHGVWSTHAKIRMGKMIKGTDANDLLQRTQSWIDTQLIEMHRDWSTFFK